MSGSAGILWSSVPRSAFAFVRGESNIGSFQMSRHVVRSFASCCGSPLTARNEFQPASIDFTVGTLDNPSIAPPQHHVFSRSAPEWLVLQDGLPRHDKFRPATPGLTGTALPR